ncbi:HypC/HybG/HupF family hydrogenase formation chaperone [Massilibacteroides sp.]|uniref:HypC/HybG/HupF family hydrogenase formation chaperone n=1 Tax=Massilibacteroides sp. TaxID=2034766 RepID=UPI0026101394|nr:HypC/HybG/HupF family hydrogenase formation chaperone [Massilibacteroides sp.]MDD4515481.1 HypC/HybG/HupF family hydrogenase formation chaperone [Massilibacteroides sp.]
MCLAIPGKIISIDNSVPDLKMAKVDFGGMMKNVCIQWIDANIGDYILAHAGMAISTVNEEYAKETLMDFEKLADSDE